MKDTKKDETNKQMKEQKTDRMNKQNIHRRKEK